MRSRFFLIVSIALFIASCSQFVNLGDKSADSADNTEGLPDEIYENDGADKGAETDYGDWNEDSVDTEYYEEGGLDNGEYSDEQNAPYPDEDYSDPTGPESEPNDPDSGEPHEYPDENAYVFPESDPFPEGFSNADCNCGEDPQYDPICCNGVIVVFNLCFAHCYAINSGNKICTAYYAGLCAGYETSDDDTEELPVNDDEESGHDGEIIDDSDFEMPDSDEDVLNNECACYPEEEAAIFSCGEGSYLVTSCLADCLCEDPEKISF